MPNKIITNIYKKKYFKVNNHDTIYKAVNLFCEELYNVVLEQGYVKLNGPYNKKRLGFGIRKRLVTKEELEKRKDLIIVPGRGNYSYEFYVDAKNSNKGLLRFEAPLKQRERLRHLLETTTIEFPYVNQ